MCKRPKHPTSLPSPPSLTPTHQPQTLGASGFPADCHFCWCKLGHRWPSIARLHPRRPLGFTRLGRLILPLSPAFIPDPDPEGRREEKKKSITGESGWGQGGSTRSLTSVSGEGGVVGCKVCVCCKRSGQEKKTYTDQRPCGYKCQACQGSNL